MGRGKESQRGDAASGAKKNLNLKVKKQFVSRMKGPVRQKTHLNNDIEGGEGGGKQQSKQKKLEI